MKRRQFLQSSLCLAAHGAAFSALAGKFTLAQAATLANGRRALLGGGEYRALVCLYLYGGNDSMNFIVPRDASAHATYAATRGSIHVPLSKLVALTPSASGAVYGLHPGYDTALNQAPDPAMTSLANLFNQPNSPLAMVANVGPLLFPTTKAQYQGGSVALPPQLFSHEDQGTYWQTPAANTFDRIGWGGLLADRFSTQNQNPNFAMTISLDGENVFQAAEQVVPYFLSPWGVETIGNINPTWSEPTNRRAALYQLLNGPLNSPLERTYADGFKRTVSNYEEVISALCGFNGNNDLGTCTVNPLRDTLGNIFNPGGYNANDPDAGLDGLAMQLKMVAKVIAARSVLGMERQIFFVGLGGFDTHDDQATNHPALLASLANGLTKFYQATQALGLANNITTFTASEFGRTLSVNGDGTDHGWGGHHLVMGGAVQGGQFYGRFPSLAQSAANPDDAGWGQIIPTTSVDQYAWTLARWYGVPPEDRDLIFPNVNRFSDITAGGTGQPHLNFLG